MLDLLVVEHLADVVDDARRHVRVIETLEQRFRIHRHRDFLDGGVRLGVSTRGMGSLEQGRDGIMEVKNDFHLATVDIVQDPSAPDAFVNGIMEGVEWVWDNGILKAQQIEQYETEIKNATSKRLAEAQLKVWNDFLSKL